MSETEMVQVGNYPNLPLAEVAKRSLTEQGIDAEIFNGQMDTYFLTAAGGIKLMVRSEDLEAAQTILTTDHPVDDEIVGPGEEIGSDAVYCSQCHSKNIQAEAVAPAQSDIPGVEWLKNHLGNKFSYRCRDCGLEWKR